MLQLHSCIFATSYPTKGQAVKARKLGKFSWCCDLFLLKQMGENSRTAHKY